MKQSTPHDKPPRRLYMKSLDPNVPRKQAPENAGSLVSTIKRTSNDRSNHPAIGRTQANIITYVSEDVVIAKTNEGQFTEVRMRREIFKRMKKLPKEPVCFILVFLSTRRSCLTSDMNAPVKRATYEGL